MQLCRQKTLQTGHIIDIDRSVAVDVGGDGLVFGQLRKNSAKALCSSVASEIVTSQSMLTSLIMSNSS